MWSEKRALGGHPVLGARNPARVRNNPKDVGARGNPGTQAPEENAWLRSRPKRLRLASGAAAGSRRPAPSSGKGGGARSTPRRAAPTSSQKNSFRKLELGTSILPSAFCVGTCLSDLKEENHHAPKLQLTFVLLSNTLIDEKLRRLNYLVRPLPTSSSLSPFLHKSQSAIPEDKCDLGLIIPVGPP